MRHRGIRRTVLAALTVSLLVLAGGALASEDIAKAEDLVCTACHDKPGSKLLTDRGKYYELMGSLEGFAQVKQTFAQCTYCHARKPGAKKLTKAGKSFAFAIGDMQALLDWMRSEHPAEPSGGDAESSAASDEGEDGEEAPAPRMMPAH